MNIPLTKAIRALLARLMFVIHALIAIWRIVTVTHNSAYWMLTLILIIIFVEGAMIIFTRGANENRWFCTCIFLYLCAVVPTLWLLQFELSPARKSQNQTATTATPELPYQEHALFRIGAFSVSVHIPIDNELWLQLLQQTMLVIVILGRWILPKGDITRDQLSQLLLVFLAMGADIVELFDTFKENIVRNHLHLTFIVLGVWTVSLMQFPLILTGGRPAGGLPEDHVQEWGVYRANRGMPNGKSISGDWDDDLRKCSSVTTDSTLNYRKANRWKNYSVSNQVIHLMTEDMSFWSIITSTTLQDLPYLVTRLYLLIAYRTISFTMIFFTCKNILVVVLQWYRLLVISCEYRHRVRYLSYFRRYYEAASTMGKESSVPDSPLTAMAKATVGGLLPHSRSDWSPGLTRFSLFTTPAEQVHRSAMRRPRRFRTVANLVTFRSKVDEEKDKLSEEEDEDEQTAHSSVFFTSSASFISSFRGGSRRQSFGSLSATAVPYYYTSLAAMNPEYESARLFRQCRSFDDDSGVWM